MTNSPMIAMQGGQIVDPQPQHIATYDLLPSLEYRVTCSCSSSWTHKASSTFDERLAIFESHVAYDKHKPMVTL